MRFLSFQENSHGAIAVQRMRHYAETLFTVDLHNVVLTEGHVWGAAQGTSPSPPPHALCLSLCPLTRVPFE